MAQLVRASPCHGEGRRFESDLGRFITNNVVEKYYGILAQLGEHLPYKQRVIGSSPIGPTSNFILVNAGVAELADAQDLKSCGTYTPVPVRFRSPAFMMREKKTENIENSMICSFFLFIDKTRIFMTLKSNCHLGIVKNPISTLVFIEIVCMKNNWRRKESMNVF